MIQRIVELFPPGIGMWIIVLAPLVLVSLMAFFVARRYRDPGSQDNVRPSPLDVLRVIHSREPSPLDSEAIAGK
ncbi:MAG: hypothetical protein HY914_20695, partial [Desulfomonile tiedjei]|nr:hypothetical protein [Desulfomonile tiedjei]